MPRQVGLIKIIGTIDGITHYEAKNVFYTRRKGGPSTEQVATDPAFQRTRENSSEFGRAIRDGKLFRRAFVEMIKFSSDYQLTARVNKMMSQVKCFDQTSIRGQRNVTEGLKLQDGKSLLKNFNFNQSAPLDSILLKSLPIDLSNDQLYIFDLTPKLDMKIATGATHVSFRAARANIDFDQSVSETVYSNTISIPIESIAQLVQLRFVEPVKVTTGKQVIVLQILFYQEVNGTSYFLQSTNHNCMAVVEVI